MATPELRHLAAELLFAASRQVAITDYRRDSLAAVLEEWPPNEIALQAEFEHLFAAGQAAAEKTAAALDVLLGGSGHDPDLAQLIRRLKGDPATHDLGRDFEQWRFARREGKTTVDEGRDIRNAAIHHFVDKRQAAPGDWTYTVKDGGRRGRVRSGRLADFPPAYADHIGELLPLIEAIAAHWGVRREIAPQAR